jgi:porin
MTRLKRTFAALVCLGMLVQVAVAQESEPVESESETESDGTQSGYTDLGKFGGPEDVEARLRENDKERESTYEFDNLQRSLKPYFDWKRGVNDEHGVSVGSSLYLLYQKANSDLGGDDDALGYVFRQQGNWAFSGRGTNSPGRLQWRFEARSNIGGFISPGQLGAATGVAALAPGFAYSHNFDFDLAIINWTQGFNDGKAGFAVGRLGFDVYLDAFPFQTLSKGFINRAFILNPTIATTGIGALGAVVKGFVSDNFWIGAQMHDANAASGSFDFDTVQEGEWLKAIEVGWTPSQTRYSKDRVQFTYWEKDARELAGTSKGSGWVVSAAYELSDSVFPFVRFGHSDGGGGAPAEDAISVGVQISKRAHEVWSIGAGWAKPSRDTFGPGLGSETVIETSYQFQLSKNFSLTPDLQVVFNPANNPGQKSVWIFGIRGILTL